MAKKLGMNPKKLPSLIPSKSQQWKQPVGVFIEVCYAKRFGNKPDLRQEKEGSRPPRRPKERLDSWPEAQHAAFADRDDPAPHRPARHAPDRADWNADDVICHLINVADDLQRHLADGRVTRETMTSIANDLRQVANEIEAGKSVSQMPYADLCGFDDEIPF